MESEIGAISNSSLANGRKGGDKVQGEVSRGLKTCLS